LTITIRCKAGKRGRENGHLRSSARVFSARPISRSAQGKLLKQRAFDRKEVDKIMAKLKKEEKIVSPKRCYWEIKK
jgi:hypothetical protein